MIRHSYFFMMTCTVLYCTVLFCTVLYWTVLYCTVLYTMLYILYCVQCITLFIIKYLFYTMLHYRCQPRDRATQVPGIPTHGY